MKRSEVIMGMPITVELDSPAAESLIDQVFSRLKQIDADYSTYQITSFISQLNNGELSTQQLPDEVRDVLAACADWRIRTDGYFDITRQGRLDPSGYVKGWAIAQAAAILEAAGAEHFYLEAGGDIATKGHNSGGAAWSVGITNPFARDRYAKIVRLSGQAIATSGNYERGGHIYNPHTGREALGLVSFSVIGSDILTADVLATAGFAMGAEPGLRFVAQSGYEGMAITQDQKVHLTAGFNHYL